MSGLHGACVLQRVAVGTGTALAPASSHSLEETPAMVQRNRPNSATLLYAQVIFWSLNTDFLIQI